MVQWIRFDLYFITLLCALVSHRTDAGTATDALAASGVKGGLIVHLGCGDGSETAKLRVGSAYIVHGLDVSSERIESARKQLLSKRLNGPISVATFNGKRLPYVDNLVSLIIVSERARDVPAEEVARVLSPWGVAMVPKGFHISDSGLKEQSISSGWAKLVKPKPDNIDDWPQYLNKADNNAVAMDSVIGPPRRLQWIGDLRWARSHMAIATTVSMVSGNGRIFAIEDRAATDNPFLPTEFHIVARNAFNGVTLWRRRITKWESITMYIKCLPVQQQRRMAVVGDVLYCTFELEGAVSAVDAATGKVLKKYQGTSPCQEVAYDQGILYLNVGQRFRSAAYNIIKTKGKKYGESTPNEPFAGSGFRKGYAPEIKDAANPKSVIMAIDAKTGKRLWTTAKLNTYTAASLSIKGDRVVYQTADGMFCVNARTGKQAWNVKKPIKNPVGHDSKTPGTLPNTVVIADGKVFAVEAGKAGGKGASAPANTVFAYSLKDGKQLWSAPSRCNYESSSDVFHVDGLLWVGGAGTPTAYDANTGKVVRTIKQKMNGPMSHDRCYRNVITKKYYINSKTGGADFLDLANGAEFPTHWTRGGCGMGVLPANGLLYSTPFSCTCSTGSMFPGLNAYASMHDMKNCSAPVKIQRLVRLQKGAAFGKVKSTAAATSNDWPTHRYDPSRSSVSKVKLSAQLTPQWTTKLPGVPSAGISVGNSVFVSDVDAHTLYAIDFGSGKISWKFIAGGRIDSPPTYYNGMLLFGCCDGWVYCLRASDGVLVWRFKDLPDRLIQVRGQIESAWPVFGSVLVLKNKLYVAAGRSSFLDGGIFLYCLDPVTGKLLKSRGIYGPFSSSSGFPIANKGSGANAGFKNDILVAKEDTLYLRHKAFDLDLKDASTAQPHIMPMGGFLDSHRQYREGWIVATQFDWWQKGVLNTLIVDGNTCFGIQGFPVYHNHSYFDPRRGSYKLISGAPASLFGGQKKGRKKGKKKGKKGKKKPATEAQPTGAGWTQNIPVAGKAMAKAGDIIFLAGEPMKLRDTSFRNYTAAYQGKLGGRLLAVSAVNGKILADYKLDAPPAWDGLLVANGKLVVTLQNGNVQCFAGR